VVMPYRDQPPLTGSIIVMSLVVVSVSSESSEGLFV
jgi:hypothetical protein